MRDVDPGDIVFSFCDTRIKAAGIATGTAQTAPKPDFGNAGLNWSEEGWFVPVYYCALEAPIRPKDHIAVLRHFLPSKSSPLQASGDGLQSVYLAATSMTCDHVCTSEKLKYPRLHSGEYRNQP